MTVLLFVATIITFLGIDYLVRRSRGESLATAAQQAQQTLRVPEGIFFSKTHTWLNLFPSGKMQLGVDDFVKRMFVHPEVTLLKAEGEIVRKGEAIIGMQEGGNSFFVHSPIDGRITQRNNRLAGQTANGEHFAQNWAYAIEPKNGAAEIRNFLLGAETRQWMKTELARLRDFMAAAAASQSGYAAMLLQDGGEPMPGVLNNFTPEQCTRFEQQFLVNE